MSKNDDAWEAIFNHRNLLKKIEKDGFAFITPSEIKESGDKREPRLLAKHDTSESRPKIFIKNHLSILPVQNDKYIIFKDDKSKLYYDISELYDKIITEEYYPKRNSSQFHSVNYEDISSESQAIDYAFLISLIRSFTNEEELDLTIRGRQRSEDFCINIPPNNQPIHISGVQIEVDAGFESSSKIYILEAKLIKHDNFNIRQLYYPYKNWSLKTTKEIIPIFFVYTNGLFYLIQFKFGEEFGNLQVVKIKCYTVNEPNKQQIVYKKFIESIIVESEPNIPFPQANDIEKVIELIRNFDKGLNNYEAVAEFFNFTSRQGQYYADAARYLGLLRRENNSSKLELTIEGAILKNTKSRNSRNYILLKQMLKKPVFNEIISLTGNNESIRLNDITIAEIIQKYVNINSTTSKRRSSTVKSWINWMDKNILFI